MEEAKRQFVLSELNKLGVTHTQDGVSIEKLSYDELKSELVLASFREIDVMTDANRWF